MGMIITSDATTFCVNLNGLSADRKLAKIRISDIRSVVTDTDDASVEIIFSNGEIQVFPYTVVDEINGDTNITSQDILFNKIEAIIFQ